HDADTLAAEACDPEPGRPARAHRRGGGYQLGDPRSARRYDRREEGRGTRLAWARVDLDRGRVKITETLQRLPGGELAFVPPKTERARREIPLPGFAVERLRRHKRSQLERRIRLGAAWHELDLVSERGDGAPLDPDAFSHGFARIAASIGLDGVR